MTVMRLGEMHAPEMAEIEKQCFSLPWTLAGVLAELRNPIAVYWGAFEDGALIGYAGLQHILDEGYITNIATAPPYRRRYAADRLLEELLRTANEKLSLRFVTLEVRESNAAARNLYEKHGFKAAGIRKGYYEKPKEDAIIMTKVFIGDDNTGH